MEKSINYFLSVIARVVPQSVPQTAGWQSVSIIFARIAEG
jgi:hypothetical protein